MSTSGGKHLYVAEKMTRQFPGKWGLSWLEAIIVVVILIVFPAHVGFWISLFFWVGVFFVQDRLTRHTHAHIVKRINQHEGVIDDGKDRHPGDSVR